MDYVLVHHGIKGQKWGVRRFQNEDGSYTSAGKIRYRNTSRYEKNGGTYTKRGVEKYKRSVEKAKATAEKYDRGEVGKLEFKTAKVQARQNYKNIRRDYMADQGKELYKRGKRVRFNNRLSGAMSQAAIFAGSTFIYNQLKYRYGSKKALTVSALIAGTATSANLATHFVSGYQNKRLRAYYSH